MPDPVLTEEQVRDRLTAKLIELSMPRGGIRRCVRAALGSTFGEKERPTDVFVGLDVVGVRWTGEQYIEVTDV